MTAGDRNGDATAGRVRLFRPNDAMLPAFEGLASRLPWYLRQELIELVDDNVITLDRVQLEDVDVDDQHIRRFICRRWSSTSPLRRAALAALARLNKRGVDLHAVHLHGRDLDRHLTPYYVGFELRYFSAVLRCFDKHAGQEWIEVVRPTRAAHRAGCRARRPGPRGGMGAKARAAALERLSPDPDGAPLLVIATVQYVGEGFDCPALDTLFLAAPIASKGRLVQAVGRVLRPHPGKATAEVHDYHDTLTGVLASSLAKRASGYRGLGFPDPRRRT